MTPTIAMLLAAVATIMPQPPLPPTISPEARATLEPRMAGLQDMSEPAIMPSVDEVRAKAAALQKASGEKMLQRYAVTVEDSVVAGVPVRIFIPKGAARPERGRVLINLHGGGFILDSGSMTENIPVAARTGIPVIAVLYRLVPDHPFPAAVDDVVAVYRALLKQRKAREIAIYGTSAGAALTAQALVRFKAERLPQPAAAGFFSGTADFADPGDSERYLPPIKGSKISRGFFVGHTNPRDTALSPLRADLTGLPPVLCITGTRDPLLSATALFQRALLRANVDADLVVFEGMPHAHWGWLDIPESDEAFDIMARFLKSRLDATK